MSLHRRALSLLLPLLLLPLTARAQSGHEHHGTPAKGTEKKSTAATAAKKGTQKNAPATAAQDADGVVGAADASMSGHGHHGNDMNARFHMELTPERPATRDDSLRAQRLVDELRASIAKYADTTDAVADGYRMFMPQIKVQRIYHFTNRRRAIGEAFRFDATKPTSLLYKRAPDGTLVLYGAMYTAPKRFDYARLDERVPLSFARWHKHVNWCVPKLRERERWMEMKDGHRVFGPESPIATRDACDAVGGRFFPSPLGWMVHVNVFADDPREIWQ